MYKSFKEGIYMADVTSNKPVEVSKDDIEKGKTMAIVAYLGVVGLVIALATDGKKNEYTKFHINQALPLDIAFVFTFIPVFGWIMSLAALVLWVMGIVAAANGEMKRLPVIGNLELIK
jgi:uncharacterized membrane protein